MTFINYSGHGIAQLAAQAGFKVVAVEMNESALHGGLARINDSLHKLVGKDVKKGTISEVRHYHYIIGEHHTSAAG